VTTLRQDDVGGSGTGRIDMCRHGLHDCYARGPSSCMSVHVWVLAFDRTRSP
jgi:hypothetical protein